MMKCKYHFEGAYASQKAAARELINKEKLIADLYSRTEEAKMAFQKLGTKACFEEKCKNLNFAFF